MASVRARVAVALGVVLAGGVAAGVVAARLRAPRIERIACIGDSITEGVVGFAAKTGIEHDPGGGYPGRLHGKLGGAVEVFNFGVGGTTSQLWLMSPRVPYGARRRTSWTLLRERQPELPLADEPPAQATSLVEAALASVHPQIAILLLGTNDIALAWDLGLGDPTTPAFADYLIERLVALRAAAARQARVVLIGDLLPDERSPGTVRETINARIAERFPDYLPLARAFEAAGPKNLLADRVHPNAAGYELLAETIVAELRARGLIR